MQCQILCVGQKMPKWCQIACDDYLTRLQRFLKCRLLEIPTSNKEEEGRKILQKISPGSHVIALEVNGAPWSTSILSKEISKWQLGAKNIQLLIGGPDGLSSTCVERADQSWSLSALTFPHALVRVILLEQLYRAGSMLVNHPYHRE